MKLSTDQRGQYYRTPNAYRPSISFTPVRATRSNQRLRLVDVKALQFAEWIPAAAGATVSLLILGQPVANIQEVTSLSPFDRSVAHCT